MAETRIELLLDTPKRVRDAFTKRSAKSRRVMQAWSEIYAPEMRRRYKRFSKGGGDWPAIQESTAVAKGSNAILINSGLMLSQFNPKFVKLKFKGSDPFATDMSFGATRKYRGGPKVAQVMKWHQEGAGRLAIRRLLVAPNKTNKRKMATAARKILLK